MAEYGLDARLPAEDLMSSWTDHCNMSADDLTPLTKAGVYEYLGETCLATLVSSRLSCLCTCTILKLNTIYVAPSNG